LNPEGINCFRFFEGRGFRLWGARTTSSDPEWKYVNLRRYFAYLERSIDRGTQWAVFEPNGDALWANVRLTIQDFLFNEWVSGALLGEKPEKAYFVKCDRSTMTQNDLDNGRLICLVGWRSSNPPNLLSSGSVNGLPTGKFKRLIVSCKWLVVTRSLMIVRRFSFRLHARKKPFNNPRLTINKRRRKYGN